MSTARFLSQPTKSSVVVKDLSLSGKEPGRTRSENISLPPEIDGSNNEAPAEIRSPVAILENQKRFLKTKGSIASAGGGLVGVHVYKSSASNSMPDSGEPCRDASSATINIAGNTPISLVDPKSEPDKLVALTSASPKKKAALVAKRLSIMKRVNKVDRLEKKKRPDAMRVRIGEHVDPPPPDPKPRLKSHTVRKGSKRCGPRKDPTEKRKKYSEDDWDTEVLPSKRKRRKLTDLEKEMEAAGLDVEVKMDISLGDGASAVPKIRNPSLWDKLSPF